FSYLEGKGVFFKNDSFGESKLPSKNVRAFGETQGKVWIGTSGGLVYFQESDRALHPVKNAILAKSSIKQITRKLNFLYVLSSWGLFRMDLKNDRWELLKEGDGIGRICLLDKGDYLAYMGKFNRVVHVSGEGALVDTLPIKLEYTYVTDIIKDKQGVVWIGTSKGLFRYHLGKREVRKYEHQEFETRSLSSSKILSLFCDLFGVIWVSTDAGGINLFDPSLENFELISSPAFNGKGIFNNTISSFTEDNLGLLYVGTANGLLVVDKKKQEMTNYLPQAEKSKGISNAIVRSLCTDLNNNIWIGTAGGGISCFNPSTHLFSHYLVDSFGGQYSNFIFSVFCGRRGQIYAATYRGAVVFDPRANRFKSLLDNALYACLKGQVIWKFYEDSEGRLFVCVPMKGVYRFDEKTNEVILFGKGEGADVEIVDIPVWSVYEDIQKQLWFGTNQGLTIYNTTDGQTTNLSSENGLGDDVIYGFLSDLNNHIWMSSNKGLLRYMPETKSFLQYGTEDGLQSKEFNQEAFYKGAGGILYFGGVKGFNFFDPLRLGVQRKAPVCIITQVKVDEQQKSTSIDPRSALLLSLDYFKHVLKFEFGVLNYYLSEKARYRYRIIEQSDDWIDLGTSHSLLFSNMLPGTYNLEVKASINGNDWSAFPAGLKFVIRPPFFRTWWFLSIMMVLLFLLTYFVYRLRLNQVSHQAELRMQMSELKMQALRAQMNPHFIFNSLNSIQHLILKNDTQQAFSYLSKFSKLLRMILETSDKPYVLLEKEIEVLKLYLELEKLRFDSRFSCVFELEDESEWADLKIPTLMLQPYVENAIWHGLLPKEGEKKLWIRIKVEDGFLLLEIEDNGIGRKRSSEVKRMQPVKYESRSTIINQNRLNLIEEKYRDLSKIEYVDLEIGGESAGTLVKLTFPIQALLIYE
ncbi:MAG: histidine kinase, partial [bacterium]|nr:histidine kinase [bacterium]